jgi:hypothetical protein
MNLLLGCLALSHLRLIWFTFPCLLRLAGTTVEDFLTAFTQGSIDLAKKYLTNSKINN